MGLKSMHIVVPDEFQYLYEVSPDRPVVKIPAEVLRRTAAPVERITKKTQDLIDRMLRAMKQANGIGLAAPQLGSSVRIVVLAPPGVRPIPLINPEVVSRSGEQVGQEGCLSIPGLYGDVNRALSVEVIGFDRKGRRVGYELEGLPARVAQHEIDHLDGVLFIDLADPATLHWEHPSSVQTAAE